MPYRELAAAPSRKKMSQFSASSARSEARLRNSDTGISWRSSSRSLDGPIRRLLTCFEPKTRPPFGHYTTSEQFAYFADRVRRENPVADPQYGYCKALVLMVGCDGCASGGLKKIHCVPGLSHAQVHVGGGHVGRGHVGGVSHCDTYYVCTSVLI